MATVQTRIKAPMWEGKPFSIFFRYGNVESLYPHYRHQLPVRTALNWGAVAVHTAARLRHRLAECSTW
jgi:hypothetical protein